MSASSESDLSVQPTLTAVSRAQQSIFDVGFGKGYNSLHGNCNFVVNRTLFCCFCSQVNYRSKESSRTINNHCATKLIMEELSQAMEGLSTRSPRSPLSPMSPDEDKHYTEVDGVSIYRKKTVVEAESSKWKDEAHELVEQLPLESSMRARAKKYMPHQLSRAIFCGHLVTDMDSIAGAIGAAELYGGVAARASEVNSETRFCLERWGVPTPPPVEELLKRFPEANVCLVDHQQTSQMNKSIQVGLWLLRH
jgi:hypothetical protein